MLKNILRANAVSCLVFGLLFVAIPAIVAAFLGSAPWLAISIIGALLIVNGLHLLWAAKRTPAKWEVIYFSVGDFLWLLATIVLIATGFWITTTKGIIVAILVALMVGLFGLMQVKAQFCRGK